MKPALVIVDVQEVLVPLIWRGAELADLIAGLADRARAQGVPVVALQQVGGAMFAPEAPGTRLSARLRLQPQDVVVQKSATDGFYRSDLATVLEDVDTIVLTGVATDYCVDATARAAVSREFDVVLVEEPPRHHGDEGLAWPPPRRPLEGDRRVGTAVDSDEDLSHAPIVRTARPVA